MSRDNLIEMATKTMHAEVCCPCDPEAFDRWLGQVRAEAWEEGHHAGQHNEHEHRPGRAITNPYRQEQES